MNACQVKGTIAKLACADKADDLGRAYDWRTISAAAVHLRSTGTGTGTGTAGVLVPAKQLRRALRVELCRLRRRQEGRHRRSSPCIHATIALVLMGRPILVLARHRILGGVRVLRCRRCCRCRPSPRCRCVGGRALRLLLRQRLDHRDGLRVVGDLLHC